MPLTSAARFIATKTWSQERGPSVCFRNWKADSHCSCLHGYALGITIRFQTQWLDERYWVIDFGGMKDLKEVIDNFFDHATIVAADDPYLEKFVQMEKDGVVRLRVMPTVSVEAFAAWIFGIAGEWLNDKHPERAKVVHVHSVTINEHTGNEVTFNYPNGDDR
jgi:6-pyruvoyltetrahydropterin/6-carboxytetrahydropterin synthase